MGEVGSDWVRWNTHLSTVVEVEVFGHQFKLAQDPNSQNLGTTVWDSSIVLAKYLEKNARKGECARHKVKGKRCVELGAGMGLGGLAFALLGADVVLTDLKDVLPLLHRNYETNLSPSALRASGSDWYGNVGKVEVKELDWANELQRAALEPVDYVLAADCIYHEHIIEDLLKTLLRLCTPKTTVLVVNERRSETVHSRFLNIFGQYFRIKEMPRSKMHPLYQHPAIQIFQLKLLRERPAPSGAAAEACASQQAAATGSRQQKPTATMAATIADMAAACSGHADMLAAAEAANSGRAAGTVSDIGQQPHSMAAAEGGALITKSRDHTGRDEHQKGCTADEGAKQGVFRQQCLAGWTSCSATGQLDGGTGSNEEGTSEGASSGEGSLGGGKPGTAHATECQQQVSAAEQRQWETKRAGAKAARELAEIFKSHNMG